MLVLAGAVAGAPAGAAAGLESIAIETAAGPVQYFEVEVAATPRARSRGLMYRRALAPRAGMLFDFERPQPVAMWMLNTFIPLDMLFIRADGSIESIAADARPRSVEPIASRGDVLAVLELPGGTAARLDLRPGDRVCHRLFGRGATSGPAARR